MHPTSYLRYFIYERQFKLKQWWIDEFGKGEWRGIDGRPVTSPDHLDPPPADYEWPHRSL